MLQFYRCRAACLLFCSVVLAGTCIAFVGCRNQQSSNLVSQEEQFKAEEERKMMVDTGEPNDALVYYEDTFNELELNKEGLKGDALIDSKNLSAMIEFLGYTGLDPKDLEDISSKELMKRFPDDILASAFFAPKITDVSVSLTDAGKNPINPGWRKVIRLKARKDSPAQKKGIASGFLLFNKFQGVNHNVDPFEPRLDKSNESKTTQLMLVRAEGSKLRRPIYFFVFGPISDQGKLITFLTASFDARNPAIGAKGQYFVPKACAECHGKKLRDITDDREYSNLKLNYLDTDHWFDRLNDDFAFLKETPFSVIFDSKSDGTAEEKAEAFEKAFDILRRLNGEIKEQNEKVEPTPSPSPGSTPVESFQLRAARKWTQLHETDSRHQDFFARALPPEGDTQWRADRMPDRALLPLLNQYCFRCHSSLKFNIFDRPALVARKRRILDFLHRPITDNFRMPQDRNLDLSAKTLEDKRKIFELVCDLDATPCPTPTPTPP